MPRGIKKQPKFWKGMEFHYNGFDYKVHSITQSSLRLKNKEFVIDDVFIQLKRDGNWEDHKWIRRKKLLKILDF